MIDRISTKFRNIYESKLNNAEIACINPKYAFEYARYNCLDRFELGEAIIATSAFYSSMYAQYVLKSRFELGEAIIATSADDSYVYAISILHVRFELDEKAIDL